MSVDGTFLTGPLGGCLLTAVAQDANNQIVPLAFGHCWKETAETWAEFLALFVAAFGKPKVCASSVSPDPSPDPLPHPPPRSLLAHLPSHLPGHLL